MTPSGLALARTVGPSVLVVGDALEVEVMVPSGTPVLRVSPEALDGEPAPLALAVLDARSYSVDVLARVRWSRRLAKVPAILLTEGDDRAADDAVGADDVLVSPLHRTAARRVFSLLELGRARLSLEHMHRSLDAARPLSDRPSVRQAIHRKMFDQKILDGVDVGIVTTDLDGRVTFVNRCARDVLRRGPHGLEGFDVRGVLALSDDLATLAARPSDRRWVHTLRADGDEIEIDLSVSHVEETSQGAPGFFFIFHDRTHDKQLEMERRRFERLAAMGTMVAGFAHEIRNPMASLRSLAESLNEELAEAHLKLSHVDRMLLVLERVERLVRTSLLFGRPSPPRPAAHRPWTLMSAALSALSPRTRELGADLNVETETPLQDVFVDDGQMVQVLVILLNNAIDATGSPKRVMLRAQSDRPTDARGRKSEPPPRYVRLDVKDDGRGIPPDIVGRIFDPFFTTKASGIGLGLSIAQQLATENNARIEVMSAVGGPTTFSLLVPVAGVDAVPLSVK